MFSIVYISRANQFFTESALLELLRRSRENNLRNQITGMLLYKDGNFMQLLEGEQEAVTKLYGKIAEDTRHVNVNMLIEGPIEHRQFPDWSMGFKDLATVDPKEIPAYTPFLQTPLKKEEFSADPSRGQQLLTLFKKIG